MKPPARVPSSERIEARLTAVDDHYGIDGDGFSEALHVFVDAARLGERFARGGAFVVGDLGMGSGRNLLTLWSIFETVAPPDSRLTIHTFKRDPLPMP